MNGWKLEYSESWQIKGTERIEIFIEYLHSKYISARQSSSFHIPTKTQVLHYLATSHLNSIDTRDSNNLFVISNFKVLIFYKPVGISAEEFQDKYSSWLLKPKTSP